MNRSRFPQLRWALLMALFCVASMAAAANVPEYRLTIKDHMFDTSQLKVPANTQFKLLVQNKDPTPEEFESNDFNREKIVMPNSTITVFVGPLKAGHYRFFGDFHQETAHGTLIVE